MVQNETKQVGFIVISDQRFVQWECSIVDTMYSRQRQGVPAAFVKVVALGRRSVCAADYSSLQDIAEVRYLR